MHKHAGHFYRILYKNGNINIPLKWISAVSTVQAVCGSLGIFMYAGYVCYKEQAVRHCISHCSILGSISVLDGLWSYIFLFYGQNEHRAHQAGCSVQLSLFVSHVSVRKIQKSDHSFIHYVRLKIQNSQRAISVHYFVPFMREGSQQEVGELRSKCWKISKYKKNVFSKYSVSSRHLKDCGAISDRYSELLFDTRVQTTVSVFLLTNVRRLHRSQLS